MREVKRDANYLASTDPDEDPADLLHGALEAQGFSGEFRTVYEHGGWWVRGWCESEERERCFAVVDYYGRVSDRSAVEETYLDVVEVRS